MKMTYPFLTTLLIVAAATIIANAQDQTPSPHPSGIGTKSMDICTTDIKKVCGNPMFNLETQKECLVTNWTKISSDCQDALAKPSRGLGGEEQTRQDPAESVPAPRSRSTPRN
jgi:hypothetical protein